MQLYRTFGLTLNSEITFPFLLPLQEPRADADVHIRIGDVPLSLPHTKCIKGFQCAPDDVLFHIENVARFWVRHKKEIIVQPAHHADAPQVGTFLLGSAMGALLHQRGHIVLHANAVAKNGRALLFAGHQGVGKSTTAAAFCKRGYEVLTDDLAVVGASSEEIPVVLPGYGIMKLKEDALAWLSHTEMAHAQLIDSCGAYEKQVLKSTKPGNGEAHIAAIYIVERSMAPGPAQELSGFRKLSAVRRQVFRPFFVGPVQREEVFFNKLSHLIERVPVFTLPRPQGLTELAYVVQELEHIHEGL